MSALAVVTRPAQRNSDDRTLVEAVRVGDEAAFEILFTRYQGRIIAYVRGMVRDHGRAEDITQEVFLSALRRIRETDRDIAFKPWIYEIAKNACIDAFRRARVSSEVSLDADCGAGSYDHRGLASAAQTPDAAVDTKVAIDNLCGAFGALSQAHHDILVMREFEGLTYREIGERLGMSRAAVESTLFRARRRLGEEYEELVTGQRCVRVREIVDAGSRAAGQRDGRRRDRHLAHCQPCRRYASRSGMTLDAEPGVARRRAASVAKASAVLPLPLGVRRRPRADDLLGDSAVAPGWSTGIGAALDPSALSAWSKALATAATVAVASVGAVTAVRDRMGVDRSVKPVVAEAEHSTPSSSSAGRAATKRRAASRGPDGRGAEVVQRTSRGGGLAGADPPAALPTAAPPSAAAVPTSTPASSASDAPAAPRAPAGGAPRPAHAQVPVVDSGAARPSVGSVVRDTGSAVPAVVGGVVGVVDKTVAQVAVPNVVVVVGPDPAAPAHAPAHAPAVQPTVSVTVKPAGPPGGPGAG